MSRNHRDTLASSQEAPPPLLCPLAALDHLGQAKTSPRNPNLVVLPSPALLWPLLPCLQGAPHPSLKAEPSAVPPGTYFHLWCRRSKRHSPAIVNFRRPFIEHSSFLLCGVWPWWGNSYWLSNDMDLISTDVVLGWGWCWGSESLKSCPFNLPFIY